jgi:hypothetical protein
MATKVYKKDNLLIIDNGTKKKYLNAAWCSISFDSDSVNIYNNVSLGSGVHDILFTDFQDLSATPYATEDAIVSYLSDKIG